MQINHTENTLTNFPTIQTERLELVKITQLHLKDIYNLFADENVTRFYNLLPLTEESEAQKLTAFMTGKKILLFLWLAMNLDWIRLIHVNICATLWSFAEHVL